MLIEKITYLRVISIFVFNTLEIILRKEELQLECCGPFYITNEVRKIVWLSKLKLKVENNAITLVSSFMRGNQI